MFQSAVLRLTAAYVAIVMTISIIFSTVIYRVAVQELQTGFQNQYLRWLDTYQTYGLRQPGTPTEEIALRSHEILIQIVYFNVFLFLLTALACYMLARKTLQPLEHAHEQQKRFTADVSHELRTPLTTLKMETEVTLANAKSSQKQLRSTLQSNLEDLLRMEKLIDNLLVLSTIEADKLRLKFTKLDTKIIADEAVQLIRKYADAKSVTIKVNVEPYPVSGDQASLTQLLSILLENAVKYSPNASEVFIASERKANSVFLHVRDNGEGIPREALPHVFDRFYRADKSRGHANSDSAQGFGLGLSLAKLIADLHGGEIILASKLGSGTKASLRLPVYSSRRKTTAQ